MIDKNNTIILLDFNSLIGKIVRLILNRNAGLRDGYNFYQHTKGITYFPNHNDKKFILVDDIFNEEFKKDIFKKDPNFRTIIFNKTEKQPLEILTELWSETSDIKEMTDQELDILIKISKIFENLEDKESIVMKYYIENFVNVLTSGKEFFSKDFKEIEDIVKWYNNKDIPEYNTTGVTTIEQYMVDEKKFFEPNTYQIVLNFKGDDLERVLLDFYKKYPELKQYFNLIREVEDDEDISSIMEQKLLLESLYLVNVEYYNKRIKKSNTENIINQNILGDIISIITSIRNRFVTRKNKK